MLEVLITIIIVSLGLLGLAGLQARVQVAEQEAYQRTQAIVLLQEMVDRVNANRKNAADYVTASPAGTGNAIGNCAAGGLTVAQVDLCQWNNALLGAAEAAGGSNIGAMTGARGCITNPVTTMPREVVIAVVWQGLTPTADPSTTNCGDGLYGTGANANATRRALTARVMIGCLQNDPTTGVCITP
jgi:type IV pilus assembly protein PilV